MEWFPIEERGIDLGKFEKRLNLESEIDFLTFDVLKDEEHGWRFEDLKRQTTWRAQLVFRERKHLEIFESLKEVERRSVNIYKEKGSERNISSAKLASPFQTVMMKKQLFTRFHSRVVSDHVHQQ